MKSISFLVVALCTVAAFSFLLSCQDTSRFFDPGNHVIKLKGHYGFPDPPSPADNLPTSNRLALGKRLFSDPILSRDSSISCASCHIESLAFTDGLPKSKGVRGKTAFRNAPSLINCAYLPNTMWDGGVPTLEQQVLAPISNPLEMDFDANKIVSRILAHPTYPELFRRAYGEAPSVYSLTRAISCYERTLVSGTSRYDRFLYGHDTSALSAREKRGKDLFFGEKCECFHCHGEYNFTDNSFKNNGIYANYPDSGRARITLKKSDLGSFRVPSLRNVARTAPYMHDGSLPTLDAVIDHYISGGKANPNKSGLLKPMHLTAQEKQDLIAFLKALTD